MITGEPDDRPRITQLFMERIGVAEELDREWVQSQRWMSTCHGDRAVHNCALLTASAAGGRNLAGRLAATCRSNPAFAIGSPGSPRPIKPAFKSRDFGISYPFQTRGCRIRRSDRGRPQERLSVRRIDRIGSAAAPEACV